MAHLLLVDNDPDILELLRLGIEEFGYEVRTAPSGVEALRSIEREPPDVLVTDLIMPNVSGEKLLRIVRSVPEWSHIRTVVISGVAAEAPEIRARTPCDIYIAKGPISTTVKHLIDALTNFDTMSTQQRDSTLGIDHIHSRHITRELLEFKRDVDTILDHISDGVCKIDRDLIIVWMNRSFTRLTGYDEAEILGRSIRGILPTSAVDALQRIASTESPTEDDDVAEFHFEKTQRLVRATPLYRWNGRDDAAFIWQNVTDRLLLEEQYENIVESTRDLVWTTDLEGRLNYLSRSSRRTLGLDPEDLIGTPFWCVAIEQDREEASREARTLLVDVRAEVQEEQRVFEWRGLHASGEPLWIQVRASTLRDRAGHVIGLQGVFSDITRERSLLAEREALLHEINHRVRDNLQLVASLARVSSPDLLAGRITAIGEVFDELYRERSFSHVKPAPLIHRVVAAALAGGGCGMIDDPDYQIEIESLPMRRAVPLALLINEIITEVCANKIVLDGTRSLYIRLERTEQSHRLTVEAGHIGRLTDTPGAPIATSSILTLMVEQLHGSAVLYESGRARRYYVLFD